MTTHPAHRVRRLADAIAARKASTPLSNNKLLAERMAGLAALLWELDDVAFKRAAEWANTGLVSGGGGTGSGGGPSQPTELAAMVGLDKPDRLAAYDRWLRAWRAQLERTIPDMLRVMEDIGTRSGGVELDHPGTTVLRDPITGKENRVPICAEYFCEDGAESPRHGRCDPCAKWRTRWVESHDGSTLADCPVVPKDVIDARRVAKRRKKAA